MRRRLKLTDLEALKQRGSMAGETSKSPNSTEPTSTNGDGKTLSAGKSEQPEVLDETLQSSNPTEPTSANSNGETLFTVKSEQPEVPDETLQSSNPTEPISTNGNSEQLEVPDETWNPESLGEYAKVEEEWIGKFHKQMAIHVWRLGKALTIAKGKVKAGEWKSSKNWCDFLKRYKVSVSSDWRAQELYSRCPDEKPLAGMSITKAYQTLGLLKEPEGESPENPATPKAGKKKDDLPPPPKEDPKTLTMFLAAVEQRLELFFDDSAFIDQDKKESPEHVRELIDHVITQLQKMKEMLPKQETKQKQGKGKAK
jgi:hypothetical protein